MPAYPAISLAQISRSLASGALLLDVRSPEEYHTAHLAGSVSAPLERLANQIGYIAQCSEQPLLLYCTTGERSRTAAQILERLGYQRLFIVSS